jgi:type I restriction enzyme S subunit
MSMNQSQQKILNIPKLRFPEFTGEWQEKSLGDIFFKKQERNNNGEIKNVLTNSAVEGIVNQQDFFDKDIANQNNLTNYFVVDVDDFIYNPRISRSAPVGPLKRNTLQRGIMSPLYTVLKPKIGNLSYLESYFKTKKWHKYMYKIANYGARHDRMNILNNDFMKLPVPFPSFPEQQKIAYFLESVDSWISNLKSQKESLEQYKKGMMQKIFDQEIRFKDENGQDFPDWKERSLGEVIKEEVQKTTKNNQHPVLSSTKNTICLQSDYFNREIASSNNIGYKILKRNQLVFSPQNIWLGNININTYYDIGIVSPSYKIYNINKNFTSVDYIKYIVKLPRMLFEYEISSEQGASVVRRNLNINLFHNIRLNLPSLPEQQKIASFFSSLDDQIQLKAQQIEKAKQWKKGLMQGLFV